jgi:NAD(P)H-hydrate epimerase
VAGPAIRASVTVALAALKLPLVQMPAAEYAGRLVVADIGIPRSVIDAVDGPWIEAVTRDEARRLIPRRRPDSHKGHYGHVLVAAGSPGKTGAAILAARAALRSGAGLVTLAVPASLVPIVAAHDPEVMTLGLPESVDGTVAAEALGVIPSSGADVIVAGPGLGRGEDVVSFVLGLLSLDVPLVLDADALNALADARAKWAPRRSATIITPHPGEMARLAQSSTADVQARRIEIARDFATAHDVHVVLKGHRTVVSTPGGRVSLNMTGNPGMATAGSGDVLAGAIGGWLGQIGEASAAARLAVYVHGLAGDLAAKEVGQVALIARDIIDQLGAAVQRVAGPDAEGLEW